MKTLAADGTVAAERQLTEFPHPYPTLRGLQKEILRYHRDDGVELTATLYLPPGERRGGAAIDSRTAGTAGECVCCHVRSA